MICGKSCVGAFVDSEANNMQALRLSTLALL